MDCTRDVSQTPRTVTRSTRIVQALFRRLITPRGMLAADKSYGFCVEDMLGDTVGQSTVSNIRQGIAAECLKEDGVRRVSVDARWIPETRTLRIRVDAIGPDGAFGFDAAATDGAGLVLDGED